MTSYHKNTLEKRKVKKVRIAREGAIDGFSSKCVMLLHFSVKILAQYFSNFHGAYTRWSKILMLELTKWIFSDYRFLRFERFGFALFVHSLHLKFVLLAFL